MKTSYRPIMPKGIEDYLKGLCLIYRGEMDNPHDVNAVMDDERKIQILKYHLWDAEKSILETPGSWKFIYLTEKGSLPSDDKSMAQKLYDFAVRKKLDKIKEFGVDLTDVYERVREL